MTPTFNISKIACYNRQIFTYLILVFLFYITQVIMGFSGGSDSKESNCNEGDLDSNPGLGRCPGEENGYPLQCASLENSMDRGAWQNTGEGCHAFPMNHSCAQSVSQADSLQPHGLYSLVSYGPWGYKESGMTERLSLKLL